MDFENILNLGVIKNIINEEQKNNLIDLYNHQVGDTKQVSDVVKVFYYIGGVVMLCAMSFLMSRTVMSSTYTVILLLGILYAVLFFGIAEYLWRKNEKFPAEILYFLFISIVEFLLLDISKMTGFFPHFSDIDKYPDYWDMCVLPTIIIAGLTIVANAVLQKFRQASLLAIPTICSACLIYMSIIDFIYGWKNITGMIICNSYLLFGLGLTAVAFVKDRLTKVDYSKWMYFFGAVVIFISCQMLLYEFDIELWLTNLLTFILSLIYILIGLLIQRKPFSIIGILGAIEYIAYLEIVNLSGINATLFTSIVLFTGLAILYAGVLYSKNVDKIRKFIINLLPQAVQKYLPQNRV